MDSNDKILLKYRVIKKLETAMYLVPEMRICQFIATLTGRDDNFYVKDETLEKLLDEFIKKGSFDK